MDPVTAIANAVAEFSKAIVMLGKIIPSVSQRVFLKLDDMNKELEEVMAEYKEHISQDIENPNNTRDDNKVAYLRSDILSRVEAIKRYKEDILIYIREEK